MTVVGKTAFQLNNWGLHPSKGLPMVNTITLLKKVAGYGKCVSVTLLNPGKPFDAADLGSMKTVTQGLNAQNFLNKDWSQK